MKCSRWVRIGGAGSARSTMMVVGLAALTACAPGGGPGGPGRGDAGGGSERSQAACTDGVDNDGDGLGDCMDPDCAVWRECGGGGVPDAGTMIDECVSDTSVAEPSYAPVDIIWAIDNSGSMGEEAMIVQNNIDDFAMDIFASGINYRVVLITAAGFVNVPDPLGSDDTHLRRIEASINSHAAFEVMLETFSQYSDFLRPDAKTHIVVVTDDESDMRETDFRSRMMSNLGHDFTFHAIASEDAEHDCVPILGICQPGCEGPFGDAADVGARYYRLAATTGGTTFSICTADWSPLFTTLKASIVTSAMLPCFYALPDPPEGEALDFESVNVVYTPSSGTGDVSFPRAGTAADCAGSNAWYYDDNSAPAQINLCPAACSVVEADTSGAVTIQLGCEQILL